MKITPQTGGTATQAGQVKPSGDSTPTGEPNKADDQGTQIKPTKVLQTTNETGNQKPSGQTGNTENTPNDGTQLKPNNDPAVTGTPNTNGEQTGQPNATVTPGQGNEEINGASKPEKCLRNLKKTIQLPLNLVQLHLGILIKTHK